MLQLQPLEPAKRPDPGPPVQRHLISAGVLVVAAGLLFAVIGMVRSPDQVPDGPEIVAAPDTPADSTVDTPPAEVDDEPATPVDQEPAPPVDEDPVDEPDPATQPDEPVAEDPDDTDPEPADPVDEEPPATSGAIDPATVSVQVLDAVRSNGSDAAMQELADEIEAAGYDLITTNPAGKLYDVTTVMYSPGQEAAARQVAAEFGFAEVIPNNGTLTTGVDVHVIMGSDRV